MPKELKTVINLGKLLLGEQVKAIKLAEALDRAIENPSPRTITSLLKHVNKAKR